MYLSFKEEQHIFSMSKMSVVFTVPTKHEDITVITFRFSDIVEDSCHTGMALSSGELLIVFIEP